MPDIGNPHGSRRRPPLNEVSSKANVGAGFKRDRGSIGGVTGSNAGRAAGYTPSAMDDGNQSVRSSIRYAGGPPKPNGM